MSTSGPHAIYIYYIAYTLPAFLLICFHVPCIPTNWLPYRDKYLAKIPAKVRGDYEGFCAVELTCTVWCDCSGFQCDRLRFKVSEKNYKSCKKNAMKLDFDGGRGQVLRVWTALHFCKMFEVLSAVKPSSETSLKKVYQAIELGRLEIRCTSAK